MNNLEHLNQVVQVKKCRAWGYVTVDMINKDGSIRKRDKTLAVKFPEDSQEAAVPGSLWEISGKERLNEFTVNGYGIIEYVIDADCIKYLRPSGRILARYISTNVNRIGDVIANRLVRLKNLNDIVKKRDIDSLLSVSGMTEYKVEQLIEGWPDDCLHETIEWLEAQQLPHNLGDKLISIFNENAIDNVKANPFLLMAMGVSFKKTLSVAESLGYTMQDDCIVAGVAQYVASKFCEKTKSTVIDNQSLIKGCSEILPQPASQNVGDIAVECGLLVKVKNDYQVYGSALMEAAVAQHIISAYQREPGEGELLAVWEKHVTKEGIKQALAGYESTLNFELTDEQREAVIGCILAPVSAISGGAGTGKTTILKAILGVYDIIARGMPYYLMALAERAAQRMAESTGRDAQSIAKFVYDQKKGKNSNLPGYLLIVIDEASMVDLLSMYQLIGLLPLATRFLFVGDTSQLPPVGKGLVYHALQNTPIPFFNLSQVKRQNELSGIHRFATSVRESALELPMLTQKTLAESSDCSIEPNASIDRLIDLWREAGGAKTCIILSPIRRGEMGVENINAVLQSVDGLSRPELHYRDSQRGWIPWITRSGTKLLEGDPILVTANNYDEDADIRNGDLGVIKHVYSQSSTLGILELNGELIEITEDFLGSLELGYAVTIHKSQGSEWPTGFVMLPTEAMQMIDQSLIYTAATRPTERLVLMGDKTLIEQAVKIGSNALNRRTFISERMLKLLAIEQGKTEYVTSTERQKLNRTA